MGVEQQLPSAKVLPQFVAPEQTVMARLEHGHESRALDQRIDDRKPALGNVFLNVGEQRQRFSPREEHQQADRDHGVVLSGDRIAAGIREHRRDVQFFRRGNFSDPLDRRRAGIDRHDLSPAPRRLDAQIAQTAAQIEHAPAHERQRDFLERVERKVVSRHLLLELGVEKSDAVIDVHLEVRGNLLLQISLRHHFLTKMTLSYGLVAQDQYLALVRPGYGLVTRR